MRIKDFEKLFYFSTGNKKLAPTETTKYLIWSLPAITTCPNATTACKFNCYARKAEKQYPDVLPCRTKNYEFSKSDLFVSYMSEYIRLKASSRTWKQAKRIIIRIHESGDFYSYEYFAKWMRIAEVCSGIPNLVFMAYTKSLPFVADYRKVNGHEPENVFIRSSVWDDTTDEMIELTEALNLPIYTACTSDAWNVLEKVNQCDCKCCSTCHKCWSNIKKLYCEIH